MSACSSRSRSGPGVPLQHVRADPAGYRHPAALRAARSQPAVRGGVPEQVRMEPSKARGRGAACEALVQRVIGEALAAVAQPERVGFR